ncbi:hypothetical protein GLOIN_2v1846762 [Rhizophagus clarus]|uniref:Uncharacterized protein n=1 Tax=Rhizophagus clarus TaxID=94130 RepID=A0A8H3QKM5_9GLOM|nr:hypothetical protein GLOIN_2v1846762 [Rhizophagus clarus]
MDDFEIKVMNENDTITDNNIFGKIVNHFKHEEGEDPIVEVGYRSYDISKKEDYQIAISQDGKFVVTFDTVLENTDRRPPKSEKTTDFNNQSDESVVIEKVIVHFKINDDFAIENLYSTIGGDVINKKSGLKEGEKNDEFRWSFDISNMHIHKKDDSKSFILVAISRINVDEDMKRKDDNKIDDNVDMKGIKEKKNVNKPDYEEERLRRIKYLPKLEESREVKLYMSSSKSKNNKTLKQNDKSKKGITIYRIKLGKGKGADEEEKEHVLGAITCYYSNKISGICRFIEDSSENSGEDNSNDDELKSLHDSELRRFIILNYRGMYNFEFNKYYNFFKLNEKFVYPQNIRRELDNWYTNTSYDLWDLVKMEHETDARLVENIVDKYDNYIFTVGMLQLCFAQANIIKLFYMENGLQIASKKFDEIERIHFLEFIDNDEKLFIIGEEEGEDPEEDKNALKFIIWDLYNTSKYELINDFQIYTNVENIYTRLARTSGNILRVDGSGKVLSTLKKVEEYDKDKKSHIVTGLELESINDKEPWMISDYERNPYCLYQNKTGTETLQLIVGRSTVQVWHQIQDDSKADDLPNKGEPFLEYIWANRIPVNQESEETRLRIEEFKCGLNNDGSKSKIIDFYLKVRWYEKEETENGLKEIRREKVIKQKDIVRKFRIVRHACKALEHIKKRKNNIADNYKYEAMIDFIEHIVWRFAKHEQENFRLLDVRHNLMKSLIMSNCYRLIKFILFGDDEGISENKIDYDEL